ncbi:MAG: isochorismate synthase [Lentisphaeria bacterium]|nr:isochorismate synthase [Candidatus Neomarinimicrobiota bacterium]MCF7841996.1 isochorismate synthase [Lentisphaeria bacterium]
MAGLLSSTIRIPDLHQLPELFPRHLAELRDRLHRGDKSVKPTIIKIKFEPNNGETIDQLTWLNCQKSLPKIAWYAREGDYAVAAIGKAQAHLAPQVNASGDLKAILDGLTDRDAAYLTWFGGVAFDPYLDVEMGWRSFGAYRFVAPQFYLETEGDRQRFVVQTIAPEKISPALDELLEAFAALHWDMTPAELPLTQVLGRDEFPKHTHWLEIHEQAMQDIGSGTFDKVVLAKKEVLNLASNLSTGAIFNQLVHQNSKSYRFYFEFEPNCVFMGASPERLFLRQQHSLESEALAATRPRGASSPENVAMGQELMSSGKDRREHQIVMNQLQTRFQKLADTIQSDDSPGIVETPFVQHLYQQIRGTLKSEIGLGEILTTLHPTPALGGFPRSKALEAIRHYEDFSRGWFGGPVGWIRGNDAEFAVGIRSALITDVRQIFLYAGVGIVTGSDAEMEWQEMRQKFQTITASLGL